MNIGELYLQLVQLMAQEKHNNIPCLQLGIHEHEDMPLKSIRVVTFAGKTTVFLRFE